MNRLIASFHESQNKILFTSKGQKRKNFPLKEALLFSRDFENVVIVLNKIYGGGFDPVKCLSGSMIIIASQLKDLGIEAFSNLISSLEWMIATIFSQNADLAAALEDNQELLSKLQESERHISFSNDDMDVAVNDNLGLIL